MAVVRGTKEYYLYNMRDDLLVTREGGLRDPSTVVSYTRDQALRRAEDMNKRGHNIVPIRKADLTASEILPKLLNNLRRAGLGDESKYGSKLPLNYENKGDEFYTKGSDTRKFLEIIRASLHHSITTLASKTTIGNLGLSNEFKMQFIDKGLDSFYKRLETIEDLDIVSTLVELWIRDLDLPLELSDYEE